MAFDEHTPVPFGEASRYHRQMLLPGFGAGGQARLTASHAVVVGCGALGTTIADQLARAGVGTLTLIDRDIVEWTNLQRQVLFCESDAREAIPKAVAAANRLAKVNSQIRLRPVVADINPRSAEHLCATADVLLDGTDNFQTRYLLNDICVKTGTPLAYGGVVGTTGMTMTILPRRTPCLRCVFPELPPPGSSPTCDTVGVLGTMAAVVASIQATEALKVLLGRLDLLRPSLSQFDIWNNVRRTIGLDSVDRDDCPCCSQNRFEFLDAAADATTTICGSDSVQVLPGALVRLDLADLAVNLTPHGTFSASTFLVRGDLREHPGIRLTIFRDGRAIVHGTSDPSRARSLYSRYISA